MLKGIERRLITFVNSHSGTLITLIALISLLVHLYQLFYNLTLPIENLHHIKYNNNNYNYNDFKNNIGHLDYGLRYGSIDIVFTWVNGSDPIWNKQKKYWGDIYGINRNNNNFNINNNTDYNSTVFILNGSNNYTNNILNSSNNSSTLTSNTNLSDVDFDDRMSSNRYRDSNELRYSLRSIIKYAPWVRNIYIVTANQVPEWLNTQAEHLYVVSHEDIFPNKSHLPVFSSPAIEAHLHRIPGLSKHFIYFNDDVMLGSMTTPEDFVTLEGRQKLILAWDVPKCAKGCVDTWIGDGYCDKACNVSECNFDFPDCVNATIARVGRKDNTGIQCQKGCPNSWLADKTCDMRCNVRECAYDAGDCGINKIKSSFPGTYVTPIDIPSTTNMNTDVDVNNIDETLNDWEKQLKSESFNPKSPLALVIPSTTSAVHFNLSELIVSPSSIGVNMNEGFASQYNGTDRFEVTEAVHSDSEAIHSTFLLRLHSTLLVLLYSEQISRPDPPVYPHDIAFRVLGYDKVEERNFSSEFRLRIVDIVDEKLPLPTYPVKFKEASGRLGMCGTQITNFDLSSSNNNNNNNNDKMKSKKGEVVLSFKEPSILEVPLAKVKEGSNEEMELGIALLAGLPEHWTSDTSDSISDESINNFSIRHHIYWTGVESDTDINTDTNLMKKRKKKINREYVETRPLCQSIAALHEINGLTLQQPSSVCKNDDGDGDVYNDKKISTLGSVFNHQWYLTQSTRAESSNRNKHLLPKTAARLRRWHKAEGALLLPIPSDVLNNPVSRNVTEGIETFWLRMKVELIRISDNTPLLCNTLAVSLRKHIKGVDVEKIETDTTTETNEEVSHESTSNTTSTTATSITTESDSSDSNSNSESRRSLKDTYSQSLLHVNRLYQTTFGSESRKVPAHVPHMINTEIMQELQQRFPEQWKKTSLNKFRSGDDMQFAFSYYHYVFNRAKLQNAENLDFMNGIYYAGVDTASSSSSSSSSSSDYRRVGMVSFMRSEVDTDGDELLSEREFKILACITAKKTPCIIGAKQLIGNCTVFQPFIGVFDDDTLNPEVHTNVNTNSHINTSSIIVNATDASTDTDVTTHNNNDNNNNNNNNSRGRRMSEIQINKETTGNIYITDGHQWPTISEVMKCSTVRRAVRHHIHDKYGEMGYYKLRDGDAGIGVAFEMLGDNYTEVVGKLDSVRARKSKFICINDNMINPSVELVQELQDFFESMYPQRCSFELPIGKKNPSLYLDEMRRKGLVNKLLSSNSNSSGNSSSSSIRIYLVVLLVIVVLLYLVIGKNKNKNKK